MKSCSQRRDWYGVLWFGALTLYILLVVWLHPFCICETADSLPHICAPYVSLGTSLVIWMLYCVVFNKILMWSFFIFMYLTFIKKLWLNKRLQKYLTFIKILWKSINFLIKNNYNIILYFKILLSYKSLTNKESSCFS